MWLHTFWTDLVFLKDHNIAEMQRGRVIPKVIWPDGGSGGI